MIPTSYPTPKQNAKGLFFAGSCRGSVKAIYLPRKVNVMSNNGRKAKTMTASVPVAAWGCGSERNRLALGLVILLAAVSLVVSERIAQAQNLSGQVLQNNTGQAARVQTLVDSDGRV